MSGTKNNCVHVGVRFLLCFGGYLGFFFKVLISCSLQAQTGSFSSSTFIYLDCNPDFLVLREFICRGLQSEDTLTVLNKLPEKPDAVCRFAWLSPLKSLACLRLLPCFHFPGGWISNVLRAGYRCSSDKSQCSVILLHKHTSFGRILALQLLFWSAGQLLSINRFCQKKRPSNDLSPLAYTQAAKRMLQHIKLVPEGIFSLTKSMNLRGFLPWDSPRVHCARLSNLVSHTTY